MILASILTMGGLGLVFAMVLAVANARLKAEEDPRLEALEETLPGANCGACGFASCRALAEALIAGKSAPATCAVGGRAVAERIAQILDREVEALSRRGAVVHCRAKNGDKRKKAFYQGIESCAACELVAGGDLGCVYGCLGYGDCERACPFDAIHIIDGLAQVDYTKCTACGLCVKACPRDIISVEELILDKNFVVFCNSNDPGRDVRKYCKVGCIACGICVKNCPVNAAKLENNLSSIDLNICEMYGICEEKCPTKVIGHILISETAGQRVSETAERVTG
jgi:Na+-translocating ferredoxin:NAD+ oxidoreductase RNF subunit RnfB